ncbi:hypothetical protein C2G38_2210754 [Gigaspora rosea]|uniref:Uncharacterized protein n=1 Tax=Gigaspora rosea TaxID=44941 RepID=A0A397UN37_9GLOM|nr:hypothetical protein C2G38_2210754 [Gigaspora rosea]
MNHRRFRKTNLLHRRWFSSHEHKIFGHLLPDNPIVCRQRRLLPDHRISWSRGRHNLSRMKNDPNVCNMYLPSTVLVSREHIARKLRMRATVGYFIVKHAVMYGVTTYLKDVLFIMQS